MLRRGQPFKALVGEEDLQETNIDSKPYHVASMQVPPGLESTIDGAKCAIEQIANELFESKDGADADNFAQYSIFIDPIDGTREFSSRMGEQCSIMLGVCRDAFPVAGIIYRPLTVPPTWVLGCKSENLYQESLDASHQMPTTTSTPNPSGLLTTNGSISPFTCALLRLLCRRDGQDSSEKVEATRVRAGGAGNKVVCLLENKAQYYIQDRGVSRWDSCAPQAVLEARGGLLVKLAPFISSGQLESYHYEKTLVNLDFDPATSCELTRNNAAARLDDSQQGGVRCARVEELLPYANVQGLLALKSCDDIEKVKAACQAAARIVSPTYN